MPYSMPLWTILTKCPEPDGPTRPQPLVRRRSQRLEDRAQPRDGLVVAADHHGVALGEAPDAAAGADVDEVGAAVAAGFGAAQRVLVVGVAAVDEDVARLTPRGAAPPGWRRPASPCGNHDPHRPGCVELRHQVLERVGTATHRAATTSATASAVEVEADHVVAGGDQALGHVGAHLAETDHSELHA